MAELGLAEKVVRLHEALDAAGIPHAFGGALALAYYAEFTQEIDSWIAANNNEADELEGRWRRQQNLLAS